jgi:hypothetical protein
MFHGKVAKRNEVETPREENEMRHELSNHANPGHFVNAVISTRFVEKIWIQNYFSPIMMRLKLRSGSVDDGRCFDQGIEMPML